MVGVIVKAHGVLMFISGLLIAKGERLLGPILMIFEMEFVMVVQDCYLW